MKIVEVAEDNVQVQQTIDLIMLHKYPIVNVEYRHVEGDNLT